MSSFDPALGSRGIGAESLDVEFEQGARKLCVAFTIRGCFVVYAEDAGLVAVERHRLTVPMNVLAGGLEISECRLRTAKENHHQAACGVIDIDQRRALRRPVLEPRVFAAIDLDQFANARASRPRLLHLRGPQPPWQPKPAGGHQR